MSQLTISVIEDLGDVDPSVLGLIIAGVSLGGTPSFLPASWFADAFGRKRCVALGSTIMVCASVIQAATTGPWAFFGTRLMIGVGLGFAQTAAPPLTAEIAHPRQRGTIIAIFQTIWFFGAILSALITLATLYLSGSWSWRIPCLVQAFFPALQLLGLLIVPESPRWLVSNGRREECLGILAQYHANGDCTDELVMFEYREICEAIDMEAFVAKKSGWASFFATRGAIHRLIICILIGFMIQWAGNGMRLWCILKIAIDHPHLRRHCFILSRSNFERRRHHKSNSAGRYQPRVAGLEWDLRGWRRRCNGEVWAPPSMDVINNIDALLLRIGNGAVGRLRRVAYQSGR